MPTGLGRSPVEVQQCPLQSGAREEEEEEAEAEAEDEEDQEEAESYL